jgi:hypothetical protein
MLRNGTYGARDLAHADPTKGVRRSRQSEGGHGSRNPLRSVEQLTDRINQPRKWMVLKPGPYRAAGRSGLLPE